MRESKDVCLEGGKGREKCNYIIILKIKFKKGKKS